MGGTCQVCAHKNKVEIEGALVAREGSLTVLGQRYGVSRDSLHRHRHHHMAAALVEQGRAVVAQRHVGLLEQMAAISDRTQNLLVAAEEKDDLRATVAVIEAARRNLELQARLLAAAARTQTPVSGVSASGKPADLSGLNDGEFFALGRILAKVAGTPLPEPTSPAQRRALAGLRPLSALGQGDATGD